MTPELFARRFSGWRGSLYFKSSADGSIDIESISNITNVGNGRIYLVRGFETPERIFVGTTWGFGGSMPHMREIHRRLQTQ